MLLPVSDLLMESKEIASIVSSLLDKGVNANQTNAHGKTPLHIACERKLISLFTVIATHKCK